MKKLLTVLMAVTIGAVFFGCKKDQDVAVAMSGVVNFITGKVQIVAADGQIKDADVGSFVKKGEKIITVGNDSMADVYLGENVVRLMGNTELKLADYAVMTSSNGEKVELSLAKGSVFTKVSTKLGKDDSFNVSTPTAIAGVRGTEFTMEQLANGQINVACLDGKVAVASASNPDAAVIIEEAEEVYVEPGKDIVKKQMDEDRMNILRQRGQIRELQQNIRQQYQDQKAEIRRQFEEQREQIRQAVTDQKEENKTMVQEQREGDKALVEEQKERDRQMIEETKAAATDEANKTATEATGAAQESMQNIKSGTGTDNGANNARDQMNSVKPNIDINQFKQGQ